MLAAVAPMTVSWHLSYPHVLLKQRPTMIAAAMVGCPPAFETVLVYSTLALD
jgi:hypothetical protein